MRVLWIFLPWPFIYKATFKYSTILVICINIHLITLDPIFQFDKYSDEILTKLFLFFVLIIYFLEN